MAYKTKEEIIRLYGEDYYNELKQKRTEQSRIYRKNHPGCRKKEYARLIERNPNLNKERYWKNSDLNRARSKDYYHSNKEDCLKKSLEWARNNKDKRNIARKKWSDKNPDYNYYKTKKGRAKALCQSYNKKDTQNGLECAVTEQWVIENIFSGQVCHYCGETDWHKLGCDRIDSTKAHTPDNCVPCCKKCNPSKGKKYYGAYMLHHTPQFLTIKCEIPE